METIFVYFLKSSGLLALFFISYHTLLRKETFFNSNRWFLLSGLVTSAVLPLLVYTKVIWIAPITSNFDYTTIPLTTVVEQKSILDYLPLMALLIYGLVITLLAIKLLYDFYSLKQLLKGKVSRYEADYRLVDTKENLAPFSFFKTIVYNSELYNAIELENILEHEKVHSDQNHSFDVLIARLFCIIFWFNPFVWLYKKAILQNLEFIADSEATKKLTDKKAYQITLLKITTQENCVSITNHFYQSLIKKRIVMLNKNQSKKRNSWKYVTVLPALVAFVVLFQINVVAQEKPQEVKEASEMDNSDLKMALHVTALSTEKELNSEKEYFEKEYGLLMQFSGIQTNSNNEITAIKVALKDNKGTEKEHHIEGNKAIAPFDIFAEINKGKLADFGFATPTLNRLGNNAKLSENSGIHIKKEEGFYTINEFRKGGTNYLVLVNGIEQNGDTHVKIPTTDDILSSIILDPIEAEKKYGLKGKNGVIEITTGTTEGSTNKMNSATNQVWKNNQLTDIPDESKVMVFNQNQDKSKLDLDKTDVNNLTNKQKSKTTQTIKIVKRETNGIPADVTYYINGKIATKAEVDKMDPSMIEKMDVDKSSDNGKSIKITTKTVYESSTERTQPEKQIDYNKAIVIIDGKISDSKAMNKLSSNNIKSMDIQKPANGPESVKQAAIAKYGEKALNGIITITTK
ncbi:M56 family metallopeptidase [Flavobacterium frigidarium]|uniref:M56 family metallopeptidase n=1 Tax=Flavobacterium frigidarium TaxID=99286 RepID=UPI0004257B6B|nr:M56 family metallopeptidase [Flavobacterium frigidarium]